MGQSRVKCALQKCAAKSTATKTVGRAEPVVNVDEALSDAVKAKDVARVRMLLDAGEVALRWQDIDVETEDPLYIASKYPGYLACQEIAMLLIRHGADVNVKGRLGRTPLHLALGNENEDLAEYCRLAGAKSVPWSTRVKFGLLSSSPPTLMQTARVVVRETIMKRQNANVVAVVDSMEELPSDVKRYLKMYWL